MQSRFRLFKKYNTQTYINLFQRSRKHFFFFIFPVAALSYRYDEITWEMLSSYQCPSSTPRDLIHLVQDSGCAYAFRKAPRWFQCAARLRTTWWNEELPRNTFSIVISQGRSLINLSLSLTGEFVRNACSQATLQPCWTRNSHPCFNKPSLQGILMPRSSWRTSASVDKFWHRQEQLAPNKKIHVVKKQ